MTFANMAGLKKRTFSENRPKWKKINFFAKKLPNIGISPVFFFFGYKERKWCFYHVLKVLAPYNADIFQNGDLNILRWQPPPTFELSRLTLPHLRGYPRFFFIKMTAKDVKEMF